MLASLATQAIPMMALSLSDAIFAIARFYRVGGLRASVILSMVWRFHGYLDWKGGAVMLETVISSEIFTMGRILTPLRRSLDAQLS
jgi:hypothetical protein